MRKSIKEQVKFLLGKLEENEDSVLFARLADAYLQMDRVDEAIELCEKGIRKHPYYVTGHYVLGKCYLKKKLFDQAEKELTRVLLFDEKYIAAHRDYGELMAQIGWSNTCEMSYEEIVRIDPFNEKARQRLLELKSYVAPSDEQEPEEESEIDLEEVEETILTEVVPESEQMPEEAQAPIEEKMDEILLEIPEEAIDKPEGEPDSPPVVKELFKESADFFEDDKANLDLLEDIFRDDDLPDLSLDEDLENSLQEDEKDYVIDDFEADEQKQNYLQGEEFRIEDKGESETKDIEGLNDDEVFALMAGDENFNKTRMRSPLDIPEPPVRKERTTKEVSQDSEPVKKIMEEKESLSGSQIEEKLDYIRKETKPKLESPIDEIAAKTQQEKASIQANEEREPLHVENSKRKKEKIVTSTLGEIYAAQHQYAKAIGVYEILRRKDPDNEFYKQKIEYLQKKLEESQAE